MSIYLVISYGRVERRYLGFGFRILPANDLNGEGSWYELLLGPRCLRLMTNPVQWEWSKYF